MLAVRGAAASVLSRRIDPDQEYTLSQIARRVGVSLPTVHAEVGRLAGAGIIVERRLGQARLVQANPHHVLKTLADRTARVDLRPDCRPP